jgi:PAS domain S-box-containing protein
MARPPADALLAALLDGMSEAFIALDHAGRVTTLNAQTERLLGKPAAGLHGRVPWQAVEPLRTTGLEAQCRLAAESGRPVEFETEYPAGAQTYRVRVQPYPAGLLIFWQDVSERTAIAAELRASEEKFAKAFTAGPLILTITDLVSGRFIEVNDSFVSTSGWSREEAIGRTPVELGLWSEPEQREQGRQVLQAGGAIRDLEARLRVRSGEERVGLLAAEIVHIGGRPCVLTALTDITERLRAEAVLTRYRLLSEHTQDIVLFIRPDGRIVEANAAAVAAYGYTHAELLQRNIVDLRAPDTTALVPEQMTLADTEGIRFETAHLRRDGSSFPVEVSSLGADIGGERLLLSIIRDITARRQAEAERDAFLSNVTHDLRTPLTGLLGAAQLAVRQLHRAEPDAVAQALESLGAVERAAQRMTGLIDELLDLARLQSGRSLDLHRGRVDLVALVRRMVAEVEASAPRHAFEIAAAAPSLVGEWDRRRLERVVRNLLTNAVKYSAFGSPITLQLAVEDVDGASWALLEVADVGVGIPAADLPHVFERFYRGANARLMGAGTGIGLAAVRQIVAEHGGAVAVRSEEGVGTTITVRLPRSAGGTSPPGLRPDPSPSHDGEG